MPTRLFCLTRLPFVFATMAGSASSVRAVDSEAVKRLLREPPVEYSTAPLWVWADDLTPEQVVTSLRELAAQNVRQAFVHPRPGLMTPYLSDKWFELWRATLEEARRLGMKIWIYDENSYPSGFAGGFVPDAMPESRALGLAVEKSKDPPADLSQCVAAYSVAGGNVARLGTGETPGQISSSGDVEYVSFKLHQTGTTPWLAGRFYVDLMRRDVTQKFIEVTHEVYARELGEHFGTLIPGIFTDEPNVDAGGGVPWSARFAEAFQHRWGYDLLDALPSLTNRVGDWRRVRHDFWRLVLEQFIDHWAKPQMEWCERHGLEWTGHYWEHEWPLARRVPDNMAMYAWHQRPAIDILFNQYNEGVNAQFGNTRAVKELASVANQLGRKRTLCETYGAAGWDLRFEDMKRIADWLFVLGVNTIDEHIADISIRGARKHDHPQSFSYHEPWWPDYHVMATYLTRLSAVMSQGEQINDILVLEPTTTGWMYQDAADRGQLMAIGNAFQSLVHALEMAQVEFDLGCEDIISRHGSVRADGFVVGRRAYRTVVFPPLMENVEPRVAELLAAFVEQGGRVLCAGEPPGLFSGRPSDAFKAPASMSNWVRTDAAALPALLARSAKPDLRVERTEGDKGILFHHRRQVEDGQILLLVNTSISEPSAGRIRAAGGGIEQWNLQTGLPEAYAFERSENQIHATCHLPPSGSLLLFVSRDRPLVPRQSVAEKASLIRAADPPEVRRLDANVLTLDYVDVTAGGETKTGLNVVRAANFVFARHGLKGNPWDRAVQFKDELIRRTFPADSGLKATYRFTIRGPVPSRLELVVERADLYAITCNGRPVSCPPGQWWLDRSFGRMDISRAAKEGENEVTLEASPLTMYHEIDNACVLGDFGLQAAERGFVIVPAQPLRLGAWSEQGMPLYGGAVAYRQIFDVSDTAGRYRLRLGRWYGSVARVLVDGTSAGVVAAPPWECDLSGRLRAGRNVIEIIVVGTLKNTLGPHHGNPAPGIAGPFSWDAAPAEGPPPGAAYSIVAYGLWEPAVLERLDAPAATE